MHARLRRTGRALQRHVTRQGVAWVALFMAVTGTSFAATSITYPTSISGDEPMTMSWVKIDGETGRVLDEAGKTFTTRRTTNGTYEVTFSGYRSADCAATVTAHDISGANRLVTEIDESTSTIAVRAYLAYTELNYDTDLTVMFACE